MGAELVLERERQVWARYAGPVMLGSLWRHCCMHASPAPSTPSPLCLAPCSGPSSVAGRPPTYLQAGPPLLLVQGPKHPHPQGWRLAGLVEVQVKFASLCAKSLRDQSIEMNSISKGGCGWPTLRLTSSCALAARAHRAQGALHGARAAARLVVTRPPPGG